MLVLISVITCFVGDITCFVGAYEGNRCVLRKKVKFRLASGEVKWEIAIHVKPSH